LLFEMVALAAAIKKRKRSPLQKKCPSEMFAKCNLSHAAAMSNASTGVTLAGVFVCETAAALLVGAAGRPLAGAGCVAVAVALAFRWLRAQRRRAEAGARERLALARAEALAAATGGQVDRAIEILEQARDDAPLDGPAARLLIETYARRDDLSRAVEVAVEHLPLLDPDDVRNMIASLEAWNERQHAAALAFAVTVQSTAAGRANQRPLHLSRE
jgi:hypothetical protein